MKMLTRVDPMLDKIPNEMAMQFFKKQHYDDRLSSYCL